MSDESRQERADLAAALRLGAYFELNEGVCNHFSYALPGKEVRFLLNPYGLHWSEVRARDVLMVDGKGRVIEGEGQAELTAIAIHAPVHRNHRRARCVLHTHMPYATALTSIGDGILEPVTQNALRFYDDVAYDRQYSGLAEGEAEGERLALVMGDKRVLFMEHHGVMIVGDRWRKHRDGLRRFVLSGARLHGAGAGHVDGPTLEAGHRQGGRYVRQLVRSGR